MKIRLNPTLPTIERIPALHRVLDHLETFWSRDWQVTDDFQGFCDALRSLEAARDNVARLAGIHRHCGPFLL